MFRTVDLANRLWEVTGRHWVVQTQYDNQRDWWVVEVVETEKIDGPVASGMKLIIRAEDCIRAEGDWTYFLDEVIDQMRQGQQFFTPHRPAITVRASRIQVTPLDSQAQASVAQGSSLRPLDREPANPTIGDLWIDISGDGKLKTWDGSGDWVEIAPNLEQGEMTDAAKLLIAKAVAEEQEMLRRHEEEAREIYEATLRKRAAQ